MTLCASWTAFSHAMFSSYLNVVEYPLPCLKSTGFNSDKQLAASLFPAACSLLLDATPRHGSR
jgi:hypothetical protein